MNTTTTTAWRRYMSKTYEGILRGDHIDWGHDAPPDGRPLRVSVTILDDEDTVEESSIERAARGEAMAAHLEAIAEAGGIAGIEDPVEWQREIRTDRPLPGRRA